MNQPAVLDVSDWWAKYDALLKKISDLVVYNDPSWEITSNLFPQDYDELYKGVVELGFRDIAQFFESFPNKFVVDRKTGVVQMNQVDQKENMSAKQRSSANAQKANMDDETRALLVNYNPVPPNLSMVTSQRKEEEVETPTTTVSSSVSEKKAECIHFKFSHEEKTRRFAFPRECDLIGCVKERVEKIVERKEPLLYWRDEDSLIVLECGDDMEAAIDYAEHQKTPACVMLEATVQEKEPEIVEEKKEEVKETHVAKIVSRDDSLAAFNGFAFVCDECDAFLAPSNGGRYKCIICEDYDLCAACVAKGTHDNHALIRLLDAETVVPVDDGKGGVNNVQLMAAPRCTPSFIAQIPGNSTTKDNEAEALRSITEMLKAVVDERIQEIEKEEGKLAEEKEKLELLKRAREDQSPSEEEQELRAICRQMDEEENLRREEQRLDEERLKIEEEEREMIEERRKIIEEIALYEVLQKERERELEEERKEEEKMRIEQENREIINEIAVYEEMVKREWEKNEEELKKQMEEMLRNEDEEEKKRTEERKIMEEELERERDDQLVRDKMRRGVAMANEKEKEVFKRIMKEEMERIVAEKNIKYEKEREQERIRLADEREVSLKRTYEQEERYGREMNEETKRIRDKMIDAQYKFRQEKERIQKEGQEEDKWSYYEMEPAVDEETRKEVERIFVESGPTINRTMKWTGFEGRGLEKEENKEEEIDEMMSNIDGDLDKIDAAVEEMKQIEVALAKEQEGKKDEKKVEDNDLWIAYETWKEEVKLEQKERKDSSSLGSDIEIIDKLVEESDSVLETMHVLESKFEQMLLLPIRESAMPALPGILPAANVTAEIVPEAVSTTAYTTAPSTPTMEEFDMFTYIGAERTAPKSRQEAASKPTVEEQRESDENYDAAMEERIKRDFVLGSEEVDHIPLFLEHKVMLELYEMPNVHKTPTIMNQYCMNVAMNSESLKEHHTILNKNKQIDDKLRIYHFCLFFHFKKMINHSFQLIGMVAFEIHQRLKHMREVIGNKLHRNDCSERLFHRVCQLRTQISIFSYDEDLRYRTVCKELHRLLLTDEYTMETLNSGQSISSPIPSSSSAFTPYYDASHSPTFMPLPVPVAQPIPRTQRRSDGGEKLNEKQQALLSELFETGIFDDDEDYERMVEVSRHANNLEQAIDMMLE